MANFIVSDSYSRERTPFRLIYFTIEMTAQKSCKYGKYGSFEHLLLLVYSAKLC